MIHIPCVHCKTPVEFEEELAEYIASEFPGAPVACEDCSARLIAEAKRRKEDERLVARAKLAADFIPKNYRDINGDLMSGRHREALEHGFQGGTGVVLHGQSGVGKSWVAYHLISARLADGIFRDAEAVTGSQISRLVLDSFGERSSQQDAARGLIERMRRVDCLLLDDLDKFRPTATSVEFLFDLFKERTDTNRPIVITTQATGEVLENLLTDNRHSTAPAAIVRRIRQFCRPFFLRQAPLTTEL